MAGLTAARQLVQHGWIVTLLDKGRGVGGRMATRRMTDTEPPARADHGSPFVTPATPAFRQLLDQLVADGVMINWPTRAGADQPGYAGVEGMNAVAKHLADGLTVHTSETVVRIGTRNGGWQVETESGNLHRADTLLMTVPAPQACSLLRRSGIVLADDVRAGLEQIAYHPCIAVLALLNQPGLLAPSGVVVLADETAQTTGFDGRTTLIDNGQKGITPQPTVTILLDADFSEAHFNDDLPAVGQLVLAGLTRWIPAQAIDLVQVHRWRFSLPAVQFDGYFLDAGQPVPLLLGGDGFSPKTAGLDHWSNGLESAFWSGRSMAARLLATTS